jgi:hypothetical protein
MVTHNKLLKYYVYSLLTLDCITRNQRRRRPGRTGFTGLRNKWGGKGQGRRGVGISLVMVVKHVGAIKYMSS